MLLVVLSNDMIDDQVAAARADPVEVFTAKSV